MSVIVNGTASSGAEVIWALANAGSLSGDLNIQAGDGLASTTVTSGANGANGLNNPGAWLLILDGNTDGSVLFIRSVHSAEHWKILVSSTYGFDVGTATRPPRVTDQSAFVVNDGSKPLFFSGAQRYTASVTYDGSTTSLTAATTSLLGELQTVFLYDLALPRRAVASIVRFDKRDQARLQKSYPFIRQSPRRQF